FVAGAQCTIELGGRPVFCDVELDSYAASVETIAPLVTSSTKAIVAMPYAGRPMGLRRLAEFARERGIALVEDAAHGAGTLDEGRWPGAHSDAAVYSFYATKNLATGEGGMLVTHDAALADRVRRLSLHGMSRDAWQRYADRGSWQYDVLEPGYKYNITDLASSIGRVQLRRLEEMQRRRGQLAERYRKTLSEMPGISLQQVPDGPGDRHSWCMFAIAIDEEQTGIGRDAVISGLKERNVGTSVHYIPSHQMSAYRGLERPPLPNTERLGRTALSLPLYPGMSDADAGDVLQALAEVVGTRVTCRT
ncbi:MAG TPA: DegT/DnrJ/EryC1/StrS aminotransferase family protein, partial [Candidatus Acidoferrales bacterium]|nr:DegT/DnrJ/EryC1/StrS aminotransferase family protein [Candidatus Acidoferrales bacterium]